MDNAPNVLQPYWLVLLPLDLPDLIASLLLWSPSGQRPNYMVEKWPMNFDWKCPTSTLHAGSFTSLKSTTWDRRLYFPSEGRSAEDFFTLKNLTASVGFEPANLGNKGQHATSRPPKPLLTFAYGFWIHKHQHSWSYIFVCATVKIYFAPTQFLHLQDVSEMVDRFSEWVLSAKHGENLISL